NHSADEWVAGIAHTNSIEGFWSQLKRSINGTFHHVSKQHLQAYVDEFAFRYNRRTSERSMFDHVSERVAERHAVAA
ncbi:MAG: transposase, partial [Opitutaceae bacterium]